MRPTVLPVLLALLTAVLLTLAGGSASAWAQAPGDDDRNLEQQIAKGQRVAPGRRTLDSGHVDVGPRFVDGRWTLMVHDDGAKAAAGGRSVWRHPDRTVLRVTDDAVLQVPDDPKYGFLPAPPGSDVHVVPQTQNPDVVWLGWNTQDPDVMERIDRGVTLTLTDVQGPGDLVVYLQSGDFAEPKVLWNSTGAPKPFFVDVDTHTHANWVFTKPGVYLAQVRVSADLIDGTKVSDTRQLRFAVGSGTSVDDAYAAEWRGAPVRAQADTGGGSTGTAGTAAEPADDGGTSAVVVVGIAVVAVAVAVGLLLVLLRGRRAKLRARSGRLPADAPGTDGHR
ncbi:choice-of-anchor M domain-containing protein [Patulibacter americanus]|uniref:choice-of-anchor M domain-containing protein n=1 Tax=Patulibacter americanus TaxID=588672 RepID=UPI0003B571BF|nr:choice-of-anchor M domain-containing protein [Patulibacter americanus]